MKLVPRLGEPLGMRWANARIVISQVIQKLASEKYGMESALIPNGVTLPQLPDTKDALERFGLVSGRYALMVSRLVPEKRHLDLIRAFGEAELQGWKLVIVGASDHPDEYTREVMDSIGKMSGVVGTGFQTGQPLQELYAHAGLFVLPSSHEGLPIALLEALSYGLPVIASDIPANLEVGLPENHYFRLGDVGMLAERLGEFAARTQTEEARDALRAWVNKRYDWEKIARSTLQVYCSVLGRGAEGCDESH